MDWPADFMSADYWSAESSLPFRLATSGFQSILDLIFIDVLGLAVIFSGLCTWMVLYNKYRRRLFV